MNFSLENLDQLSKKQLMLMLARKQVEERQPISILGMACRLPGGIVTPEQLWQAIIKKKQLVGKLPNERWKANRTDYADYAINLTRGGYLSNIEYFDAEFFNISEKEALYMDPQQRILLETVWNALEDANIIRDEMANQQVGVFIAISACEYLHPLIAHNCEASELSEYMVLGTTLSASAGRISHHLGTTGPTLTIDTACSSSLIALHYASQSLRCNECDIAIVAGVHLLLSPLSTIVMSKAGLLSSKGSCSPFMENGDGFTRSEGCGALVLKRLVDAKKGEDQSYAVVRGSAYGQNGDRAGITSASGKGQIRVIESALESAGVDAGDIGFIEAQHNGSDLAGLIEIEALSEVFSKSKSNENPLYLGSLKANIGYMETASGIPGLIKTILALKKSLIPPQIGIDKLDSRIAWDSLPMRVPSESKPWPITSREKRLAGVSCFGITGTNCHVILESVGEKDAKSKDLDAARPERKSLELCLLSAKSKNSLRNNVAALLEFLKQNPQLDYRDICSVLACHREHFPFRYAFTVNNIDETRKGLQSFLDEEQCATKANKKNLGVELELSEAGAEIEHMHHFVIDNSSALHSIFWENLKELGKSKQLECEQGIQLLIDSDPQSFEFVFYYSAIQYMQMLNISFNLVEYDAQKFAPLALFALGYQEIPDLRQATRDFKTKANERALLQSLPKDLQIKTEGMQSTISRKEQYDKRVNINLCNLTNEKWIGYLSSLYMGGYKLNWKHTRSNHSYKKIVLPGYQFDRKYYWPKNNYWK